MRFVPRGVFVTLRFSGRTPRLLPLTFFLKFIPIPIHPVSSAYVSIHNRPLRRLTPQPTERGVRIASLSRQILRKRISSASPSCQLLFSLPLCWRIVLKRTLTEGGASVAILEAEPKAAQRSRQPSLRSLRESRAARRPPPHGHAAWRRERKGIFDDSPSPRAFSIPTCLTNDPADVSIPHIATG